MNYGLNHTIFDVHIYFSSLFFSLKKIIFPTSESILRLQYLPITQTLKQWSGLLICYIKVNIASLLLLPDGE